MLFRLATTKRKGLHHSVIYAVLKSQSVSMDKCMAITEEETWMTPI